MSSWWLNHPIWKICTSNWKSSPRFGVKIKKYLKPPDCDRVVLLMVQKSQTTTWDAWTPANNGISTTNLNWWTQDFWTINRWDPYKWSKINGVPVVFITPMSGPIIPFITRIGAHLVHSEMLGLERGLFFEDIRLIPNYKSSSIHILWFYCNMKTWKKHVLFMNTWPNTWWISND